MYVEHTRISILAFPGAVANQWTQIDRNAIANARLNGLEEDLGLVGTQYNTCISILFVGYDEDPLPI